MAGVSSLSARCPRRRYPASSAVCLDLLVVGVLLLIITTVPTASGVSLPGCPSKCGDVEVPYPFGISLNCSRDKTFVLTCNQTSDGTSPPMLYTPGPGGFRINRISLIQGSLEVSFFFVQRCFRRQENNKITNEVNGTRYIMSLESPLTISPVRNRFITTGCDAEFWYYATLDDNRLWTGCFSGCGSLANITNNTCDGFGCCVSNMPNGLRIVDLTLTAYNKPPDQQIYAFNPCDYAFIIDRDKFVFNASWITTDYRTKAPPQIPAVLDWSIEGTPDCSKAINSINRSTAASTYACVSANSECVKSPNERGYLCNCSTGYAGNPYLVGGCQDINECKSDRRLYPCHGNCTNTPGSYLCSCPTGTESDDPKKSKCVSKSSLTMVSKLLIGTGAGVLCCCLMISISFLIFQKRKLEQLRQKFFQQNGGVFLQQSIQSHQQTSFKIFTMVEIDKATKNFDQNFILGKGGFGAVYKGILDDGRIVAVKKSIMVEEKQNQEFAKELFILSQINHKNIVKLLGCCLESEVPMLVYEYICNGTLFDYIHKQQHKVPFAIRLKIAIESAEALRYLHTDASPTILHGDVKSSNILLDENLIPKVADFGTSILAPKDKAQFTTFVQGTCGYLDPEYMQTSQLTDKSDVYSFGVVLLELLTGKMPFYFEGKQEERNLVSTFIKKKNENKLIDIIHEDIIEDGTLKEVSRVAELSIQCLCLSGKDRPSMKEVVTVLERLYELNHQLHGPQHIQGLQKTSEGQDSFNLDGDQVTEEVQSLLKIGGR